MRRRKIGTSRGFGYVEFYDKAVANFVADKSDIQMNGHTICTELAVNAGKNPFVETLKSGNPVTLFVGNFSEAIDEERLREYFEEFGVVDHCEIARVYSDNSLVKPEPVTNSLVIQEPVTSGFIKQELVASSFIKQEPLASNFVKQGPADDSTVKQEQEPERVGKSRGFGFITFRTHEATERVLGHYAHFIDGNKIEVKVKMPKSEIEKQKLNKQNKHFQYSQIIVWNLAGDVDDELLAEYFRGFGPLKSARVLRDEDGLSRQIGHVHFVCHQSVDAVEQEEKHDDLSPGIVVEVGGTDLVKNVESSSQIKTENVKKHFSPPKTKNRGAPYHSKLFEGPAPYSGPAKKVDKSFVVPHRMPVHQYQPEKLRPQKTGGRRDVSGKDVSRPPPKSSRPPLSQQSRNDPMITAQVPSKPGKRSNDNSLSQEQEKKKQKVLNSVIVNTPNGPLVDAIIKTEW